MFVVYSFIRCFREDPRNIPFVVKDDKRTGFALLNPDSKPLGAKEASLFSQILMSMTQKPISESTQPAENVSSSSSIKPFSKHAPFLISAFIQIQSSRRPFDLQAKKELIQGMYHLLDLCNDHGRSFVLASLEANGGGGPIYKALISDWEKLHRFKGIWITFRIFIDCWLFERFQMPDRLGSRPWSAAGTSFSDTLPIC